MTNKTGDHQSISVVNWIRGLLLGLSFYLLVCFFTSFSDWNIFSSLRRQLLSYLPPEIKVSRGLEILLPNQKLNFPETNYTSASNGMIQKDHMYVFDCYWTLRTTIFFGLSESLWPAQRNIWWYCYKWAAISLKRNFKRLILKSAISESKVAFSFATLLIFDLDGNILIGCNMLGMCGK